MSDDWYTRLQPRFFRAVKTRLKSRVPLCLGMLCVIVPAFAVDWKALKPQGYVSDFAGVVDAASRAELENYAARVSQATGAQLAFVTVQSLQGEPIEDVANDLFHAWGIGRKVEDDGALVLLSIADHKSRLEVGGGLGGAIPDGMAGLLLDDMRPALRQGRAYGPAFLAAAERLGSTIAQSKGITIPPPAAQFRVRRAPQDNAPVAVVLFGIFVFLLVVTLFIRGGGGRYGGGGGGFWIGLLLGLLNSGRGGPGGGRDGGGFGGFDSGGGGGGFGGFGGGDSGGGGASSDW